MKFFSVKNDTQKDKGLDLGAELYIIMAGLRNGESHDKQPRAHFNGPYVEASPKRNTFLGHMYMERREFHELKC